jgi:hypothetical protein
MRAAHSTPGAHFPNEFHTELDGQALMVTTPEGELLHACDLRWLADRLLLGSRCTAAEHAAAGAAIAHLLGCKKAGIAP